MVGCYFHAHRPQDGQWLPADAMPKSESGQPIAYVAKGAHGLYTTVSFFTWFLHRLNGCTRLNMGLCTACYMEATNVTPGRPL